MALTKQTILSQIEITNSGIIQVRLAKQIVDGAAVISSEWHRTGVSVGGDVDAQFAAVAADLGGLGWPPVNPADIQRVKDHAAVAWTPEVIAAAKAAELANQEGVINANA